MAAASPGGGAVRNASLKLGIRRLVGRAKGTAAGSDKAKEEQELSEEAARRLAAAALVADCIHRETLVLINLYARDLEEHKKAIEHAWTKKTVMLFLYEVTGGIPSPRKRKSTVAEEDVPMEGIDEEEDITEDDVLMEDVVNNDDALLEEEEVLAEGIAPQAAMSPEELALRTAIRDVYARFYKPLLVAANAPPLSRSGMPSSALEEIATHIAASINTNIKQHFWQRQVVHIKLREKCTKKEAHAHAQRVNDLANAGNPIADDSLPDKIEGNIALMLEVHPERFISVMWRMNRLREERDVRRFAVLPLATGFVPGSCLHLDTSAFEELMKSRVWSPKDNNGKPQHAITERMKEVLRPIQAQRKDRIAREKEKGCSSKPGRRVDVPMLEEKAAIWGQCSRASTHCSTRPSDGASVDMPPLMAYRSLSASCTRQQVALQHSHHRVLQQSRNAIERVLRALQAHHQLECQHRQRRRHAARTLIRVQRRRWRIQ